MKGVESSLGRKVAIVSQSTPIGRSEVRPADHNRRML
jgi:hypothetical protein